MHFCWEICAERRCMSVDGANLSDTILQRFSVVSQGVGSGHTGSGVNRKQYTICDRILGTWRCNTSMLEPELS